MKEEIQQLIEMMSSKNYEELHATLEGYSVKELEKLAICMGGPIIWLIEEATIEDNLQRLILQHRKRKLDAEFVFSPENKAKILHVDKQLIEGYEKLNQEAEKEIMYFEKKRADKNAFIDLSEVTCWVKPFISAKDDAYDGVDGILSGTVTCQCMLCFEGKIFKKSHSDDAEYYEIKQNWNNYDMPIKIEWDDFYISNGMYVLCKHSFFSLSDIIRINAFQYEVMTTKRGCVPNF
jgi:hypothetical protein